MLLYALCTLQEYVVDKSNGSLLVVKPRLEGTACSYKSLSFVSKLTSLPLWAVMPHSWITAEILAPGSGKPSVTASSWLGAGQPVLELAAHTAGHVRDRTCTPLSYTALWYSLQTFLVFWDGKIKAQTISPPSSAWLKLHLIWNANLFYFE